LIVNVKQGFREMEFPVQVSELIYLVCSLLIVFFTFLIIIVFYF
jgi:hypothetical protein